ncbi:hypothetical protein JRO89_XS14G0019800 [Xanthoceras sorbifolium]|uniref:C2 NT-type domain-containing protein n=1 Tax=Xanthoceras sorbifolium TaxID=99658 RepID=A0ABQ8H3D2_9ROSI|nr:hypothetical protein JRO89_XS14G0019800 [Xanthoceras sorbifolium]
MFRLHKHKSEKFGDKLDFKFSNFQALQVAKGWDKLYVSIVSVDPGKTIAKSGKASVRNGNCRWMEAFSESFWIPHDDASKDIKEYFVKLAVVGSSRSILGEASVNLARYMSSKGPVPISLPLKKCNNGTVLQLKIQCLTPREKLRDGQWNDISSDLEDINVDYDDMEENKSDVSDSTFTRIVGSSSSNYLDGTSHPEEPCSRNISYSPSGSRNSFDSLEGSFGRELSNSSGVMNNLVGRQDSINSQTSSGYGSYSFYDSSRSNQSPLNSKALGSGRHLQNQREDSTRIPRAVASSPLQNAGSSKDLLEVAEVTIEELRAEARMWEQNARKVMLDFEKLQKESLDQSTHQTSLEMELSASHAKCDGLEQEIKQMKILLEESQVQPNATENSKYQAKDMDNILKELEDENKFQKESNANLEVQLKKTQQSNIELLSILQELEETIEKQKMEIDSLSNMKSEFEELGYEPGFEDGKQINTIKQVLVKKIRDTSCDSDLEGSIVEHPIRYSNTEVEPEEDRRLLELQQLQESLKNLESRIQFLERSLEEKNHEIEIERGLKIQTLRDYEAEWRGRIAEKEENIISLETKLSEALSAQGLDSMGSGNQEDHSLIKEIDVLKQKVQELERDCNELTEENLQLLFKLKDLREDLPTCDASSKPLLPECPDNNFIFATESELNELKSQICKLEEELKNKNVLIEKLSTDNLQIQCVDLQNQCDDLELQLQASKDKASYLDRELCKCCSRAEEQENEIAQLQQQLELYQGKETESKDHPVAVSPASQISKSDAFNEMSNLLSELHEEIRLSVAYLKKQQSGLHSSEDTECSYGSDKSEIPKSTDLTPKEHVESILNNFVELKMLVEMKNTLCDDEHQSRKEVRAIVANLDEVQYRLQEHNLNECTTTTYNQELKSQHTESKSEVAEPSKELLEKMTETDKLKSDNLMKEEEVEALRQSQRELETQISDLQKEKSQLEESMGMMYKEGSITSNCLDDLRNEIMVLSSNLEAQASANKVLERKASELESSKHELEVHVCELEKENVQLSERISGLEAQLRYLTDERESSRLELENSESHAVNLQEKIRRLEAETEAQKVEMKQQLQDMQNRWLEVQEECEYLKVANPKLQATAESLIEECSLLQKSNAELRQQKMKLHEQCAVLEVELKESEKAFSDMTMKLEGLEGKYSSMLEEIASKEKALNFELDALLHEHKRHKDKLVLEESLLNHMYLEKTVEVQSLQREVVQLNDQISATHDEKERTAPEAVLEVSQLHADKAMLEAALEEVRGKLKLSERNFDILQMESQTNLEQVMNELTAAKHNKEVLTADNEKLLDLLQDVKSNEEKLKSIIRGLELKLKASEYERLQLSEEISSLKVQLEKTTVLQDEVLALKRSLNETKFENEKLKASFQILSRDHEELQGERSLLIQKITSSEKAVSELDDCNRRKAALQEKVLRLQGDLTAREALGSQEIVLKNELAQMRREISQFQRKIKCLEEEKEECLRRAQALEEELKQKKEVKQDLHESVGSIYHPHPSSTSSPIHDELNLSLTGQEKDSLHVIEKPSSLDGQDRLHTGQNRIPVDDKQNYNLGSSQAIEIDSLSKIQSLENELAEALEANDMYKAQLKSLLSGELSNPSDTPMELTSEDGGVKRNEYDRKAASLEAELRDLQERYFHMSLKYAEVEAQREQLVLKLKTVNNGRKWFS